MYILMRIDKHDFEAGDFDYVEVLAHAPDRPQIDEAIDPEDFGLEQLAVLVEVKAIGTPGITFTEV